VGNPQVPRRPFGLDLYTFGYRFKPWIGAPIASADEILKYMGEVIDENGIGEHIRYGHRITGCHWSSTDNLWTVETTRKADGAKVTFTANFLWMCQGYYDHEKPYVPDWAGLSDYKGTFIHAQLWDPAIDVKGKRVLVIGSGATAATVVPAFCDAGAQVTMLQRSPTYFFCHPNQNELADRLRQIGIDEPTVHRVVRAQVMHDQDVLTKRCQTEPDVVFEELKALVRPMRARTSRSSRTSPPSIACGSSALRSAPMATCSARRGWPCAGGDRHDRPLYRKGRADGLGRGTGGRYRGRLHRLPPVRDGRHSLRRRWQGGQLARYGQLSRHDVHRRSQPRLGHGLFPGELDAACRHAGRFRVQAAQPHGRARCEADRRGATARGRGMELGPWIERDNFNPGYLMRGLDELPRGGDKPEWRHNQDYWAERVEIPAIDLEGTEFVYDGVKRTASAKAEEPVAA
jgi:hypothetical protein